MVGTRLLECSARASRADQTAVRSWPPERPSSLRHRPWPRSVCYLQRTLLEPSSLSSILGHKRTCTQKDSRAHRTDVKSSVGKTLMVVSERVFLRKASFNYAWKHSHYMNNDSHMVQYKTPTNNQFRAQAAHINQERASREPTV